MQQQHAANVKWYFQRRQAAVITSRLDGYRANTSSPWVWRIWTRSSGTYQDSAITYTNWDDGEPDGDGEQCMEIDVSEDYRWTDYDCESTECVVCEGDNIKPIFLVFAAVY